MSTLQVNSKRSPDQVAADQALYFELMAEMGHTKHIGGLAATLRIAELIDPRPGEEILDVGCGVGIADAFLAERYGCRVVGTDVTPGMVERARERAERKRAADLTEFRVADMHELPFADGRFDAAFAESVLSFSDEKEKALAEMLRVVKPGGRIAFTEATWRLPPPADMADYMARATGLPDGVLTHDKWRAILAASDLERVTAEEYPVSMREEARNQYGRLGLGDYVRTFGRFFKVLFNPRFRAIYREAFDQAPKEYFQYVGYGIYSGVKIGSDQ